MYRHLTGPERIKHQRLVIFRKLSIPPGKDADARRYNLPTGRSEVASRDLFREGTTMPVKSTEIRVHLRNWGLQ